MIATVKDSVGELLAPSQVIYRDAFDGLKADMRYTYWKGSERSDDQFFGNFSVGSSNKV